MRIMLTGLTLAGFLTAQVAVAGPCLQPRDKAAFDVAGLKSQLMVTALSCQAQDRYNGFVIKFRVALVQHERALFSYFGRAFGGHARQEHDDYITNLANLESHNGLKLGATFCARTLLLFDQVMALGSKDLPAFAAGQSVPQPVTFAACPVSHPRRIRTAQADSKRHS